MIFQFLHKINFILISMSFSIIINRQLVSYIKKVYIKLLYLFSIINILFPEKKKKEILTNPLFSTPWTGKPFHSLSPISREISISFPITPSIVTTHHEQQSKGAQSTQAATQRGGENSKFEVPRFDVGEPIPKKINTRIPLSRERESIIPPPTFPLMYSQIFVRTRRYHSSSRRSSLGVAVSPYACFFLHPPPPSHSKVEFISRPNAPGYVRLLRLSLPYSSTLFHDPRFSFRATLRAYSPLTHPSLSWKSIVRGAGGIPRNRG